MTDSAVVVVVVVVVARGKEGKKDVGAVDVKAGGRCARMLPKAELIT